MGVSKVILGEETLIDLTSDSVSSENLLQGVTAHGANGEPVEGSIVVTDNYENLNNKPSINNIELSGNKTLSDLGIASADDLQKVETKVDTIIEKAELNIKNSASGENIHLTDSANGKNVTFGLYGKATQDGEPTPDNPIEIVVSGASGSVEVKSCGKNLLKNTATSKTINGVTFTVNSDGTITVNGTATVLIAFDLAHIQAMPNGKYVLNGCPSGGGGSTYGIYCNFIESTVLTDTVNDHGDGVNCEVTNGLIFRPRIIVRSGATVNNLVFKPMLRLASDTDDTYEPYKETTSTIPTPNGLPGIPVSSGGNYTDENGQQWICDEVVKYADGSGKRIQRIKKAVFDGTEGWALSGSSNFAYLSQAMKECIVEVNTKRANLLSNYSYAQSQNWLLYTVVDYGVAISSDGSPSIRIKECTTLEDYIAYLSNTPLQIVAEVTTEPIITDLSAEEIAEIEKLYTFYPVTNISNDADCGMSIKYLCDSKNYIDNRLAQIEAVLINNI